MRYCPSCHIDFTGVLDRCPLCGSKLEGPPEGMIFPENEFARTKKLAKRSMIALMRSPHSPSWRFSACARMHQP